MIDMLGPIGRGGRDVVESPKAGKTTVLKRIANGITSNYTDIHLMIVLIGERPEEVTDMDASVEAEVVSSTFDEPVQNHVRVAEMALERASGRWKAKRMWSFCWTALPACSRAYNLTVPPSGRTLSGGMESGGAVPAQALLWRRP